MRSIAIFLLSLAMTAVLLSGSAAVAASQGQAKQNRLDMRIQEFENLCSDPKSASRRDLWLTLEEKFEYWARTGTAESRAKGAFYYARTRQELGKRSFLATDHREAVKRFAKLVKNYPKSALAPAALYRQAEVMHTRLQEHQAAVAALDKLIKSYPKAKDLQAAKKMRAEAAKAAGSASPQAPVVETAPPESPPQTARTPSHTTDPKTPTAPAEANEASSITLTNIVWKGKEQRAVVTLELDGEASFQHAFLPPDNAAGLPARVYLDVIGAIPSATLKSGIKPQGLVISRIRTGTSEKGMRITLECDGIQCYAVTKPAKSPQTIQIEVSLAQDIQGGVTVPTSDSGKKSTATSPSKAASGTSTAAQTSKDASKKPPQSVMEQLGLTVQTIMLDAGHGGKDPGAIAGGITEKQFTLAMAKRIGDLLRKKGFTVLYTRSSNRFISLQDRPDMANNKKADLFISIHVNANTKSSIRGLETYYLDSAKTQDAAVVAARENAVSVKNISDLQVILTDLMLSTKLAESRHLAKCVHNGIRKRLLNAKLEAPNNGVRSAPFYVLMGARMPAILVEFGYSTNPKDAENLKSEAYLQRQAEGVIEGILQYKAELARSVPQGK